MAEATQVFILTTIEHTFDIISADQMLSRTLSTNGLLAYRDCRQQRCVY